MDLYTLVPPYYERQEFIDTHISAIWTERYSKIGDLEITAEPNEKMKALLAEGVFIQADGSNEVAQIDTTLVEDGILKATGRMVTAIFDERIIRGAAPAPTEPPTAEPREYNITGIPLDVMNNLVARTCISGGSLTSVIPDGDKQVIAGLSLWAFSPGGTSVQFSIPYGSLGAALAQIAETYQLGYKLFLAEPGSGSIWEFMVYEGRYLTSDQTTYPVVKFSPAMDTLTDLKELRSIAGYKTAAYVYGADDGSHPPPGIAYVGVDGGIGFDRRVIMATADDITMEVAGGSSATFQEMLNQRAKDVLANNNFTKVIDGEIVPQSEFQYGVHYGLGDVVELDNGDGITSKARITEYIRAQDANGDRAYPTVSVLD